MSWRKTIVLGLILVVLAGLYYWDHHRRLRQRNQEEEHKRLFPWKAEDVSQVVLQRPSGVVDLVRDEKGDWVLREPVSARADQEEARRLVEGILRARRDRSIAQETADLESFGLNQPTYTVTVRGKSPEAGRVVLLGSKNPTEVYHYARFQGEKEVFLVSDTLGRDAQKPVLELRDKTVLGIDPDRVQLLTVWGDGEEVTLQREAEKNWRLVGPKGVWADGDAVQSLLFRLSRLKASEFLDKPEKSLAEMGLEPPRRKLLLKLKDPEEEKALLVGKEVPGDPSDGKKPRLWAKLEGDFPVVEVEASQVGEIPVGEAGWRSRTLFAFERDKVERLQLVRGEDVLDVRKVGQNQWEIEKPERLPADPVKVSDLLWTLKDERVSRFPDAHELKGVSQDRGFLEARIWLEGQENPLEATVFQPSQDGQGYYARVPAQEDLVVTAAKFVEHLEKASAWDLREKRFLNFDVSRVKKVKLQWEGRDLEILRKGEATWQSGKEELEAYRVTSLLWTAREARFEEIPSQRPGDSEMGMDAPKFHMEVFGDKMELVGRLSLGAEVQGGQGSRYAWSDPHGQIYVVGAKLLEELKKDLKAISPSLVQEGSGSGG